jgi:polysaccharide biosynthesis protein PslH
MRMLFILSRVPYPLEKGDKLRAFHMIRELSARHEIHLFCLADEQVDRTAKEKLKQYCKEVHIHRIPWYVRWVGLARALFSGKPFQVEYFYSKSAQRKLDDLIEQHMPQHIFCQLVRTAEYVRSYTVLPKTLDYMDAFSAGMKRMASRAAFPMKFIMEEEFRRLESYERDVSPLFQNHLIISEQDRDCIDIPETIHVVPNGVGTQFFESNKAEKKRDVLFTGNMSYRPNVESARFLVNDVMPIVWQTHPNAQVTLAGATPSPAVSQLKSKRVEVTGWIDDIVAVYQSSRVFIAPMLVNSGLQNKLLEAMACKIPSITTELANNALKAKADEAVLIGNDAAELAEKVCFLLDNEQRAQEIAVLGYEHVLAHYSWQREAARLEELIEG